MDRRVKLLPLVLDLRDLSWNFWLPIIVNIGIFLDFYLFRGGRFGLMQQSEIQQVFGVFSIPMVSFLVIGLFQNLVEITGKEMLLSMPYSNLKHGLLRVLRMTLLFTLCFSIVLGSLLLNCQYVMIEWGLPLVEILHFAALAFVLIVYTKNAMISYTIVGLYASLEYMTRGGYTGLLYPFEWSNPKPLSSPTEILMTLLVASICLLFLGQWRFTNREKLVR